MSRAAGSGPVQAAMLDLLRDAAERGVLWVPAYALADRIAVERSVVSRSVRSLATLGYLRTATIEGGRDVRRAVALADVDLEKALSLQPPNTQPARVRRLWPSKKGAR